MLRHQHFSHREEPPHLIYIVLGADQRGQLTQKHRIELKFVARKIQVEEIRRGIVQRAEKRHAEPWVPRVVAREVRQRHKRARVLELAQRKCKLKRHSWLRIVSQCHRGTDDTWRRAKWFGQAQRM